VVAVLDQRLATARYGSYLKASLPDFWYTTDPNQVRRSLAAIDEKARAIEDTAGQTDEPASEPEDA
jgi:ATP-dependent DNA helicase DinG